MEPEEAIEMEKRTGRTTVTTNGQVTPPKEWREKAGIEPGDKVVTIERENGNLELVPAE